MTMAGKRQLADSILGYYDIYTCSGNIRLFANIAMAYTQ